MADLELQLLRLINKQLRSSEGAGGATIDDGSVGFALAFPIGIDGENSFVTAPIVQSEMRILQDKNLIVGRQFADGTWYGVRLTQSGHARLERLESSKGWRPVFLWFGRVLDRGFNTVVLPIIVSVLTVLSLKYFGLD